MVVGKIAQFSPETDDFEAWVEVVDGYFVANDIDKSKTPEKAVAIFIASIGLPTYTLLKSLIAPEDPAKKKLEDLVKILKSHFKPAPKALAERHKFFSRKQMPGESTTGFLAELRKLAMTCKFENLNVSLRDQFLMGLASEAAMNRIFLEDDDVKLDKVVSIATSQDQADESTKALRNSTITLVTESVNKVHHGGKGQQQHSQSDGSSRSSPCPNCGRAHSKKDCPHKDTQCYSCKKKGHLAKFCRSNNQNGQDSSTVKGLKRVPVSSQVRGVKSVRKSKRPIMITVKLMVVNRVMS